MKKLLTPLLFFFTTFCAHSLSLIPNAFEGSALCGNLSTTFLLPQQLQGKYTYELIVTKNEAENIIYLDYTFEWNGEDTLKKITTDLNEYFTGESYLNQEKIEWNAVYTVSHLGTELYRDTLSAFPYRQCFETKSKCNQVKVTRKTIRKICSEYDYIPEFSASAINDSILVSFNESTKLNESSCDALGYRVQKDSLVLENLSPEFYKVYQVVGTQIYCITTPCPNAYYFPIGTADLHNCPPPKPENVFDGSRLCNNLSLTMKLPESLKGNYYYDYNAWIDELTGNLIVKYYLNYNVSAPYISEIIINLSEVFTELELPQDKEIEVIQEVEFEGILRYRKSSMGFAFQNCFEFSATCEEVQVYRKSLREKCPAYDVITSKSYEVYDDSLVAMFDDIFELNDWVCLAAGYYTNVDTIIIKDLDYRLYLLYAGESRIYKNSELPDLYVAPAFEGDIDLRECVITSLPENGNPKLGRLYPNPASENLTNSEYKGDMTFTNSTGQQYTLTGDGKYDISSLKKGLYIVSYEIDGKVIREKVIIK